VEIQAISIFHPCKLIEVIPDPYIQFYKVINLDTSRLRFEHPHNLAVPRSQILWFKSMYLRSVGYFILHLARIFISKQSFSTSLIFVFKGYNGTCMSLCCASDLGVE